MPSPRLRRPVEILIPIAPSSVVSLPFPSGGKACQRIGLRTSSPSRWRRPCSFRFMNIDSRLYQIVAAQPYPLVFATISGAHLYGFPSPDSDFDLRGAHLLPVEKITGLEVSDETLEDSRI